jgi:uncharacterized protein (UPF0333 family)
VRGQASLETLILFAAILLAVSSLLYLGEGSNEGQVLLSSARDGAENALHRAGWGGCGGCGGGW